LTLTTGITKRDQETILGSIDEGVFTVDLNWHITSFHRAAEKITYLKFDEAIGQPCSEFFRAGICDTACALRRTLATGKPMANTLTHLFTASGEKTPIRLSTAPLMERDGTLVGGVETLQDLTQVEQLRQELELRYAFEDIIGRTPVMVNLFTIMPQVAESGSRVLIVGASGTGNELFARAIHNLSYRKKIVVHKF
jgi:PAS domain S-box-containing protein